MFRSIMVSLLLLVWFPRCLQQNILAQETLRGKRVSSIRQGVEFLKRTQTKEGTWSFHGNTSPTNEQVVGVTALCGLALLESGVSIDDRHVQAAAKVIREKAKDPAFNYTYSVCLSVMFLNELDPFQIVTGEDEKLVLKLMEKILAGQTPEGRWGFRLEDNVTADNSSTHFAVMALWSERWHTKPEELPRTKEALAKCEKWMRASQDAQGGWAFQTLQNGKPMGSMTCAAIDCIALHVKMKHRSLFFNLVDTTRMLNEDTQITKSRAFLLGMFQANCNGKGSDSHPTYFLWSLEQVAMLLKWRKLNGEDWFDMGTRYLISKQHKNGSWVLDLWLGENVDTAFAVMFLANHNWIGSLQVIKKDPIINSEVAAKKALTNLLAAPENNQSKFLLELQEGRGNDFTYALADAIKQLPGTRPKEAARQGLVKRLEKLSASTISKYMEQDDRELRLAAVTAARVKSDKTLHDHVIVLLSDSDPQVAAAALETIKVLER